MEESNVIWWMSLLIGGFSIFMLYILIRKARGSGIFKEQITSENRIERESRREGGRMRREVRDESSSDSEGEEREKKMNRRELHKLLKRRERASRSAAILSEVPAKSRNIVYEEKQAARERERDEITRLEEEKETQKLRLENEEYDKWKHSFQLADGNQFDDAIAYQSMLGKFITYIKIRKVVQLDELGAEFSIPTQAVVERIKELEEENKLSGIIDDRGKFIYITPQELESVERYIVEKGRVSKQDLIRECNKLIRLNPTKEDQKLIASSQNEVLETMQKEMDDIQN